MCLFWIAYKDHWGLRPWALQCVPARTLHMGDTAVGTAVEQRPPQYHLALVLLR
jgi:hypothetical protein